MSGPSNNSADWDSSIPKYGYTDNHWLYLFTPVIGGAVGFLASYPVSLCLFNFHPMAGFISGGLAASFLGESGLGYDSDRFDIALRLTVLVALQTLATWATCQLINIPITFSAALCFSAIATGLVVCLALAAFDIPPSRN